MKVVTDGSVTEPKVPRDIFLSLVRNEAQARISHTWTKADVDDLLSHYSTAIDILQLLLEPSPYVDRFKTTLIAEALSKVHNQGYAEGLKRGSEIGLNNLLETLKSGVMSQR